MAALASRVIGPIEAALLPQPTGAQVARARSVPAGTAPQLPTPLAVPGFGGNKRSPAARSSSPAACGFGEVNDRRTTSGAFLSPNVDLDALDNHDAGFTDLHAALESAELPASSAHSVVRRAGGKVVVVVAGVAEESAGGSMMIGTTRAAVWRVRWRA